MLGYLKQMSNQVQNGEAMCTTCGTVNPEEIFDTVASCMVDEYGQLTETAGCHRSNGTITTT